MSLTQRAHKLFEVEGSAYLGDPTAKRGGNMVSFGATKIAIWFVAEYAADQALVLTTGFSIHAVKHFAVIIDPSESQRMLIDALLGFEGDVFPSFGSELATRPTAALALKLERDQWWFPAVTLGGNAHVAFGNDPNDISLGVWSATADAAQQPIKPRCRKWFRGNPRDALDYTRWQRFVRFVRGNKVKDWSLPPS